VCQNHIGVFLVHLSSFGKEDCQFFAVHTNMQIRIFARQYGAYCKKSRVRLPLGDLEVFVYR
jgi:hypothetical protein